MARNMAKPIYRDMFSYSGEFQVQVENGPYKHDSHSRLDSGRLYAFLTYTPPTGPALTKKGTVRVHQPKRHVDLSASCYTAQLVHYGLKPFKTKPAAKKALLAAYAAQGGTLKVPDGVLRIEQELKTQWVKENDLANKAYQAEMVKREEAALAERQKWIGMSWAKELDSFPDFSDADEVSENEEADDEEIKVAVPSKKAGKYIKASAPKKNTVTAPKGAKLSEDTQGRYIITAPAVSGGWSMARNNPLILRMCHSTTRSRIWGHIDFGVFTGNLRQTTKGLPKHKNDTITFHWRGREGGEGETTFGPENIGSITFLGGGKIKGKMHWNCLGRGQFEFTGTKQAAPNVVWEKSAPGYKQAYRSVNQRNYDVAARSRWGKWGGEERDDPPADSDSDAGTGARRGDSEPNSSDEGWEEFEESEEEVQVPVQSKKAEKFKKDSAPKKTSDKKVPKGPKLSENTQGRYTIKAPALSEGWELASEEPLILKICHSTTRTRIWGALVFGIFRGNFRQTTKGLPKHKNDTVHFLWRGREHEGETTFGPENKGSITFLDGGKIKGRMYWDCLGDFEFTGTKQAAPNVFWEKSAPDWKRAYRGINQRNYDIAAQSRWGGWGDEEEDEEPADSDSDAGKGGPRRR